VLTSPRLWLQGLVSHGSVSPRSAGRLAFAALCGLVVAWGAEPVAAQGKLEAQYEASLSGIPVGRGAWHIDITDDVFSAAASGGTTGILKSFAGGSGEPSLWLMLAGYCAVAMAARYLARGVPLPEVTARMKMHPFASGGLWGTSLGMLALALLLAPGGQTQPFIYFQF